MSLHIGVLGPLDVRLDGRPQPIPAGRLATFVAGLALRCNQVVPLPVLAEELWGTAPPRSAKGNLRNYASLARRVLGHPDRLVTSGEGYALRARPDEVDAEAFERSVHHAAGAAPREAATLLETALGLWRGPVAADVVHGPLIAARAGMLDELRVGAVEEHIAAQLRAGVVHPAELAVRLREHVAEHPYREGAWRQLMLALYRAGDPAAALAAYTAAGRILADELGIAPGPELRAMYEAVRGRDARLSAGPSLSWIGEPAPVPHQLPPASPWFTGRRPELERICQALAPAGTPVFVAVTGPPGAGKSALAVAAAHRVAAAFPDGQLYVDLSRADSSEDVLRGLLRALRQAPAPRVDAAELRTAVYGRKVLLVLDNADGFFDLGRLLPTGPGGAVLITRRSVPAGPGGVQVEIGAMPLVEARELIARVVGAAPADAAAVAAVAERCDRLPLAVRAAAVRLARRPDRPVSVFAARLRPQRFRLDELRCDSLDVREHYARACRTLGPGTTALGRLAQLRVPAYRLAALAALLDSGVREAEAVFDLLVAEHIVEPLDAGRFRLPGLLRAYGAELAGHEPTALRQAALLRAFDWYATAAEHAASPAHVRRAWLYAECENLLAVARQAARVPGGESAVRRIAGALDEHLRRGGHERHARLVRRLACDAARRMSP
jgi:DNA-binding SARP family transcriptional activator